MTKDEMLESIDGKHIRVCNRDYLIKVKNTINDGDLLGQANHEHLVIKISRAHFNISSLKDTLLHEIMHCIWNSYHVDYAGHNEELEEYLVRVFSSGLLTVLEDNKWLKILWN